MVVWHSGKQQLSFSITAICQFGAWSSSLPETNLFHPGIFPICSSTKCVYLLPNIADVIKVVET